MKVKVLVTPSDPTLCDPMDFSLLGSSVHGILQARILEWTCLELETAWALAERPPEGEDT